MKTLYDEVRRSENVYAAWRHVRRSALQSKSGKIRGQASEFEHSSQRHLRRIQAQLQKRRFQFDEVEGVLKDKETRLAQKKNPRPIAIGSMENRVVQRAILQVLQPRSIDDPSDPNSKYTIEIDPRLGRLNEVNRSRFGVGGLMKPYGGVQPAINLVLEAMHNGGTHYFQSDIKAFFTKIPTDEVVAFIRQETSDDELSEIFARALEVNLANEEELDTYASLFPKGGIGVAQGSSLSALAGNILLYEFDHALNSMNVSATRYIDDIFIVADSEAELNLAVEFSKRELSRYGFDLYPPTKGSSKASCGLCKDAFNFLGCTLQPNRCVPSKKSIEKMKSDAREMLSESKKAIQALVRNDPKFDPKKSRSSTLDRIGKKLFGWQKSFSFCTDTQAFRQIDADICKQVSDYDQIISRTIASTSPSIRMQALGIPSTASLQEADMQKRSQKRKGAR